MQNVYVIALLIHLAANCMQVLSGLFIVANYVKYALQTLFLRNTLASATQSGKFKCHINNALPVHIFLSPLIPLSARNFHVRATDESAYLLSPYIYSFNFNSEIRIANEKSALVRSFGINNFFISSNSKSEQKTMFWLNVEEFNFLNEITFRADKNAL